jgi:hypothetical protein
MKVKLNSNLFPIVSVAMYGTFLDPDSMFDSYLIESDREEGYIHFDMNYFWDNFQYDKYKEFIQQTACSFINGTHTEGFVDIEIEAGEIYSPKYYNYSNDEIDLTITFSRPKIIKEINKDIPKFDAFLKERYSSRDGFLSFTSNNYIDWLRDFGNNEDNAYGAVLSYIFQQQIEDNVSLFLDYISNEGVDYRDYVDYQKHDEECEVLHKYVKDNYKDITIDSIDYESFEFESLDIDMVKKIIKEKILEIDNKSLSLF